MSTRKQQNTLQLTTIKKFAVSNPWHVCLDTSSLCTTSSLSRYNVEGELDFLTARQGVGGGGGEGGFSDHSLQRLQKKAITIHVFVKKKSTRLWGIFNNYKEKLEYLAIIKKN